MNLLVVTKVSIPEIDRTIPDWNCAPQGCDVSVWPDVTSPPDAIISMGVGVMEETFKAATLFPFVPLHCYNWDCYAWVWTRPRSNEYDYRRYGELLKLAEEVWVPSECTRRRTRQWWDLPSHVILSSCPHWEHDDVNDRGYVLCTLRSLPDEWHDRFEKVCRSVGVPYRRTDHALSYQKYKNTIAGCRFLVSHYYEASTGGLSLLEGYYHGKPILLSGSEWNGGVDYFGDRARYFYPLLSDGLEETLLSMWNDPQPVATDHREWVEQNYSDQRMIEDMLRRVKTCEA